VIGLEIKLGSHKKKLADPPDAIPR